jgi:hypothetical protein
MSLIHLLVLLLVTKITKIDMVKVMKMNIRYGYKQAYGEGYVDGIYDQERTYKAGYNGKKFNKEAYDEGYDEGYGIKNIPKETKIVSQYAEIKRILTDLRVNYGLNIIERDVYNKKDIEDALKAFINYTFTENKQFV